MPKISLKDDSTTTHRGVDKTEELNKILKSKTTGKSSKIGKKAQLREKHRRWQTNLARMALAKNAQSGKNEDLQKNKDLLDSDSHATGQFLHLSDSLLPSLLESVRETTFKAQPITSQDRSQLLHNEISRFQSILKLPRFQDNPIDAIARHVSNSITLEKQQRAQKIQELELPAPPVQPNKRTNPKKSVPPPSKSNINQKAQQKKSKVIQQPRKR